MSNPQDQAKKKALELALSHIEKQFGEGAVMTLGKHSATRSIETIKTGALSLDMALGIGGVPRGRIVEVYGPESSGKSTLALHVVASCQKAGGHAAYIDAEHALDWTPGIHGIILEVMRGGRTFKATFLPEVILEQGIVLCVQTSTA